MSNFTIDFFELSFLAEACIPPSPIARAMFWENMIEKYYHEMTQSERYKIFRFMNRNSHFTNELERGNENVLLFHNRFNPLNQFLIHYDLGNGKEKGTVEAFKHKGDYKKSKNVTVISDYITNVERISVLNDS